MQIISAEGCDAEAPFMIKFPAPFAKFYYSGSDGELRLAEARAIAHGKTACDAITSPNEHSTKGNGTRAAAWDFFDVVDSRQEKNAHGKVNVVKTLRCNLPGKTPNSKCGQKVKASTANGTTKMLQHLRGVRDSKSYLPPEYRKAHTEAAGVVDAKSTNMVSDGMGGYELYTKFSDAFDGYVAYARMAVATNFTGSAASLLLTSLS